MSTLFFGERWDAGVVEGAVRVPTPVGEACLDCAEPVVDGDRGFVRAVGRMVGGELRPSVEPVHAECDLRSVLGHQVGVCPCTGYGRTRAAARLVWERAGMGSGV